ncbi:MAG: hypothetical protein PVF15_06535 [Candidatus Bathyarchaeota archaeon]|jgi:hypothetical protein
MEYEILFWLILVALTLITIAVLGIIYVILQGEDKNKSKAIERTVVAVTPECPHFFGYLAKQPRNKPIPGECFGCQLGMGCKRAVPMEVTIKRKRK